MPDNDAPKDTELPADTLLSHNASIFFDTLQLSQLSPLLNFI